jgi:hypothetical protein
MAQMQKMTVKEIEEYILESSPIFGLPDFRDMLRIHVTESYYKVFTRIIQEALKELDRKAPLFVSSDIYIPANSNSFEFIDNFDSYLAGTLPFEYIQLRPTSIVNLSGSLLTASRTYQLNGNVLSFPTMSGKVNVEYLTRHPYRFSKHPTEDNFTEESAIYGVGMMEDYWSDMFVNLIIFHLSKYMVELKRQANYTELPIEIFSALEDKKNEMDNVLNEFFLGPTHYSYLWR